MTAVRTPLRPAARRPAASASTPRSGAGRARLSVAVAPTATRGIRGLWVVAVMAVLVAVLVVMASQAFLVQGQDRLDELQRSLTEQEAIAERQQLQLAELQSPERVVAAATERLGMVPPSDIVHLRSDPSDDAAIAVAPEYPAEAEALIGADTPVDTPDASADTSVPLAVSDELAAGDPPVASGG